MAVLQMQKVSICALKKDRKAVLEQLQRMKVMEITQTLEEDPDFTRMDTRHERMEFEKSASLADQALEILDRYAPEKKSMFSALEGKTLIEQEDYQKVLEQKESLLCTAKKILALDKEKAEQKAGILKLENSMESLTPWMSLHVPMSYSGTAHTVMFPGTMPLATLEEIYQMLAQDVPEIDGVDVSIIHSDKDTVYLAVICLTQDAERLEEVLRNHGFARPSQVWDKEPAQVRAELEQTCRECKERILAIEKEVQSFAGERENLRILADIYRVRAEKYEVLGKLPQSERTFFITGYVPARDAGRIEERLTRKFTCVIDIEEIKENEESPTLLSNNSFSASMEGIVESYGLPKKGEFDPTTIMSFFYVFFFGMMLSDAAYGAIIAVACFVILKKFPRMSRGMHQSIKMFLYCGISTLIWGILFGGYFGNIVDIVSQKFFGTTVSIPALWFIPLNDPMKLLIYSMLFGVIHLFVGLGIKGYMCLKEKRTMDFFCDVVLWFMLLTGLILMLLPSEIFTSISQIQIVFPDAVNLLAKVLAIGGAAGILLMSGRDKKNPGLRLALGAYDLYNITGWLSDVLSYSRLLALGLATGVIASVINQMGSMLPNNIVGVIFFVIIFIVGHTLNLAINLLGAYVHTNRLQFVEFFGKFYEGGGRAFHPFAPDTKYVDVKEES